MESFLIAISSLFIAIIAFYVIIHMISYVAIGSFFLIKNHLTVDKQNNDSKLKSILHANKASQNYLTSVDDPNTFKPIGKRMSDDEYKAYLLSPEWMLKRKARLKIDDWKCQYCDSELQSFNGLNHIPNIHHLHYRNLGNENIEKDLVSLCKYCHIDLHEKYSLTDMEFHINVRRMKKYSTSV